MPFTFNKENLTNVKLSFDRGIITQIKIVAIPHKRLPLMTFSKIRTYEQAMSRLVTILLYLIVLDFQQLLVVVE